MKYQRGILQLPTSQQLYTLQYTKGYIVKRENQGKESVIYRKQISGKEINIDERKKKIIPGMLLFIPAQVLSFSKTCPLVFVWGSFWYLSQDNCWLGQAFPLPSDTPLLAKPGQHSNEFGWCTPVLASILSLWLSFSTCSWVAFSVILSMWPCPFPFQFRCVALYTITGFLYFKLTNWKTQNFLYIIFE